MGQRGTQAKQMPDYVMRLPRLIQLCDLASFSAGETVILAVRARKSSANLLRKTATRHQWLARCITYRLPQFHNLREASLSLHGQLHERIALSRVSSIRR